MWVEEFMLNKGQIFTLDISIASLFLLSISLSLVWLTEYTFSLQNMDFETGNLLITGKSTYNAVINKIEVEPGIVSKNNIDAIKYSKIRSELGIERYDFLLEVLDVDCEGNYYDCRLHKGTSSINISNAVSFTAPVLISQEEGYTHGLLKFSLWERKTYTYTGED